MIVDSLHGFKPIKVNCRNGESVSVTKNGLTFTAAVVSKLGKPAHVSLLVDATGKRIAIQKVNKNNRNAMMFFRPGKDVYGVRWNSKPLLQSVLEITGWSVDRVGYTVPGEYVDDENAFIFDLNSATTYIAK